MLKEVFEAVAAQAVAASRASVQRLPGEPNHIYGVFAPDGTWQEFEADPPPRANSAGSIDAIIAMAEHEKELSGGEAEIWYDRTGVTLFLDRSNRRDRVTLSLEHSPQFCRLMAWANAADGFQLKQRALLLTLRTMFANNMQMCPNLVSSLRLLRWSNSADTTSSIQTGKASIGKQIQGQVTGESTLPETFTLMVPVFSHPTMPWQVAIPVALEPLPETESFALFPLPGAIEACIVEAENKLGEAIRASWDGLVLYGSPE